MTTAEELFRDPPPDRETYVLGQAVAFNPRQWTDRLPGEGWWPRQLDACPVQGGWPVVDRRAVFRMAECADTPRDRRDLLVAALVWGTGLKAQSVERRVRIFQGIDPARLDERLQLAFEALRTGDPVAAYLVMNDLDERIKHLGPAFFSKVLYFATADRPVGELWPLIIDQNVVAALNDLDGPDWDPRKRQDSARYARYLELAHGWARQWGTAPDVVERKLFDHGKRLGVSR